MRQSLKRMDISGFQDETTVLHQTDLPISGWRKVSGGFELTVQEESRQEHTLFFSAQMP